MDKMDAFDQHHRQATVRSRSRPCPKNKIPSRDPTCNTNIPYRFSRRETTIRMSVLLVLLTVAVASSFRFAQPTAWRGRITFKTLPVTYPLKHESVSLFCNRREPWQATNSTSSGRPHNYTIYGRTFDPTNQGSDFRGRITSNQKLPGIHGFVNGWDAKWINASSFNVHQLLPDDWVEIESYWDRIMPTVSYLGTEKVSKIYKALCVAYSAHRGQMRKSGEPFIVHVRSPPQFMASYGAHIFFSRWKYRCSWQG